MKVFHILEEFSEKNNSIVTVTKILSNYKETKNSKIVFPEDKKKLLIMKKHIRQSAYTKIYLNLSQKYIFFN